MANATLNSHTPGASDTVSFRHSYADRRTLGNAVLSVLAVVLSLIAMFPLFSVLYMLLVKGAAMLSPSLFTELTPGAGMDGGGISNAIVGTLVVVLIATILALPLGFMGAVYLAEYGGESRLATVVRFAAKVLTGLPSILAGVFAYALVVVTTGSFSALAGGAAMAILMIPTVMLTSESALRAVPSKMKMAAFGMGATRAQVVIKIVIPAAVPGILTGVMLALARAMGETAPLLFTALFSDYMFEGKIDQPIASLSVLIYNFAGSPFEHQVALAWAASLVLVAIVLVLNVTAQVATRRPEEHG
ncbi:MAG TPA: phosphate ABC transporter permease PstA [Polyangiaceae bacterium]|jgi:phosphate transport system permease protein|nr:phosphate ABC transporter permease PstA [Polyangiaceae bacterium]